MGCIRLSLCLTLLHVWLSLIELAKRILCVSHMTCISTAYQIELNSMIRYPCVPIQYLKSQNVICREHDIISTNINLVVAKNSTITNFANTRTYTLGKLIRIKINVKFVPYLKIKINIHCSYLSKILFRYFIIIFTKIRS